ncbi:hypothetical protein ACDX78_18350 [Virgibacillus oceani]
MNKYVKNIHAIMGIVILFLLLSQPVLGIPFGIAKVFIIAAGAYAIYLNYKELTPDM